MLSQKQSYYMRASTEVNGPDSTMASWKPKATKKKDVEANKKSHSEAERRRRERINAHFTALRTLVPIKHKADKASILAAAVHQVKELSKLVADVVDNDSSFPSETDELGLSYIDDNDDSTICASVTCDDRVQLTMDLMQVIRSVDGKVVKAEMTTVGGRTKIVMVIKVKQEGGCGNKECLLELRRGLKSVIDHPSVGGGGMSSVVALEGGQGQALLGNKRPRLSQFHYHQQQHPSCYN